MSDSRPPGLTSDTPPLSSGNRCISLSQPDDWKEALAGTRHALGHTWGWCRAIQLTTGMPTFLYVHDAPFGRVICPISQRTLAGYVDLVTPYGFSGFALAGSVRSFAHYWRTFASSTGAVCSYVGLHPVLTDENLLSQPDLRTYRSSFVLDLTLSTETLASNLSPSRRRELRHWTQYTFEVNTADAIDFFIRNYSRFILAKGADSTYHFSQDTLRAIVALKDVICVGIRTASGITSVSLFGTVPPVGEYLFNVAVPNGPSHAAVLLWWAVNHCKELGLHYLHLGGGVREDDGITEFKRRFGAFRLPLACQTQVYRPEAYRVLCNRSGVDPYTSNYFPAYRAPNSTSPG